MQTVSECPTCQGTGGKVIDKRGAGANAEGLVNQEETISVKNTCRRFGRYAAACGR